MSEKQSCHDNPLAKEVAGLLNNGEIDGAYMKMLQEAGQIFSPTPPPGKSIMESMAQQNFAFAKDVQCFAPDHVKLSSDDPMTSTIEFK